MTPDEVQATAPPATPHIAIVGLACRYPDGDDPAALLDVIVHGRRAFRRIPPERVELADYYDRDRSVADTTYSTRAALIEGWRFDRIAFGVSKSEYASTDQAHWLALETAARALAGAGYPGGAGLPGERTGVFFGTAPAGDAGSAAALRLRWPYARRALAAALAECRVADEMSDRVLAAAGRRYLAPLAPVSAHTLAGSTTASVTTTICRHLGLRGGGHAIDAAGASSLAATVSACVALASGEVDVALAGGVDLSIGPLELVGLAKAGLLATGEVRVYDESPSGLLPGEGCGVLLLMRTADARVDGLPVLAEISGWGTAANGQAARPEPEGAAYLLAMRRAHDMAGIDPADVQLIEGAGAGDQAGDQSELAALADLRAGARHVAAIGTISANIGHTGAAAGAAGLIKATLAIANGVLPPSTGVRTPHPLLRGGRPSLRLPEAAEEWPPGIRHAAVSAASTQGLAVHMLLRSEPGEEVPAAKAAQARSRGLPRAVQVSPPVQADAADSGGWSPRAGKSLRPGKSRSSAPPVYLTEPALRLPATRPPSLYSAGTGHPFAYLLQAPGQRAMIALLSRIRDIGQRLSDAELQDLAVTLARAHGAPGMPAAGQSGVRVALVASGQDDLAARAGQAMVLVPDLKTPGLVARPGIFAARNGQSAAGRIALILSGQPDDLADLPQRQLSRTLAVLRWLDDVGVEAAAAVGHGIGEIAGLVWAGCTTPADARTLTALRWSALSATADSAPGLLGSAIDTYGAIAFKPGRRRLLSGATAKEVGEPDAIAGILCAELLEARLASAQAAKGPDVSARPLATAVAAITQDAALVVRTGSDERLNNAVGVLRSRVPLVGIDGDPSDDGTVAQAAAALFAAGGLTRPAALYAQRPSRPFDLWHEPVFIAGPCQSAQERTVQPPVPPVPDTAAATSAAPRSAPAERTPRKATRAGTGSRPWFRCYAERRQRPSFTVPVGDERPWRLHTGGCEGSERQAGDIFRHDATARRTLAVLGTLDRAGSRPALLQAAADAVVTGSLVVISPGQGPAGLLGTLHAEHPEIGITVLRAPVTAAGLQAAKRFAATVPGHYRELVIEQDGTPSEPAMSPLTGPGGGDFPFGPQDVMLISRGSGAACLVLAQVVACSGAAIAVVGRDGPGSGDQVIAGLEELRGAGVRIGYEMVSLSDHAALVAAVRRIEARFGRVTAIAHAGSILPRVELSVMSHAGTDRQVLASLSSLDQIAAAVRTAGRSGPGPGQLRLVVTSGSIAGRYGMAGEGGTALTSAALADFGERVAAASAGCRALHVDWPGWLGDGLGQRADLSVLLAEAGIAPLPVAEGSRQLLKALSHRDLPGRLAVHGRAGVPAPRPLAVAGARQSKKASPPARFAERVLVHYPGVEVVTEATLGLLTDPYLADYRVDGAMMLPPGMALEAMAQAAALLADRPVKNAEDVLADVPVVLPDSPAGTSVIRVTAVRDGDEIVVRLRSEDSGFAVDHCRATFRAGAVAPPLPESGGAEARQPDSEDADIRTLPVDRVYGPVCFQEGRFRVLRQVSLDRAGTATGQAVSGGGKPWFGAVPSPRGQAGTELVLGSAALADAALQLAQACVPDRRLLFAGCDQAWFAGQAASGPVAIRVSKASRQGTAGQPDGPGLVPEPRPAPGELEAGQLQGAQPLRVWDATVTDSEGKLLVAWRGLRMRDAGPLPQAKTGKADQQVTRDKSRN